VQVSWCLCNRALPTDAPAYGLATRLRTAVTASLGAGVWLALVAYALRGYGI